jgi:hypothetical protein
MALDFLAEAWALVDGPLESSQQMNHQFQLAGAYIRIDSARGFEIIESSIEKFNELFAATVTLESFEHHGTFRDKEMILHRGGGGGGRGINYLQQYGQHLATLALADPDRVQTVIARFARPEPRATLQMTVVQQLLTQARVSKRATTRSADRDE